MYSFMLQITIQATTTSKHQHTKDLQAATSGISERQREKGYQLSVGQVIWAECCQRQWLKMLGFRMKWSFILDHWCAVRRTSRACSAASERLLPCFCSVTASPSRSMLPTARVRQDFHSHSTTLFFLVWHHLSAWYPSFFFFFLIRVAVWFASSQSFSIHSRLLSCAVLPGSLRYPAQAEEQENLFPLSLFFGFEKRSPWSLFSKFTVWKNFWLTQAGWNRAESDFIYYFTHQQSYVFWRG